MKCIKCGTEFFEGVFCPECGTKYDEDEAKIAEKKEEEKVKLEEEELVKVQEVELAKAKVEQERLAKERVEQEAEVLKLKKEEAERNAAKEEKLSRTFNNVEYQTIEEAKAASKAYEEEQVRMQQQKKIDSFAIWSLILGIASWPLTMLIVGEFLTIPAVIFGVKALKNKTTKKGCAIGGIVSVGIYVLVLVIGLIFALTE